MTKGIPYTNARMGGGDPADYLQTSAPGQIIRCRPVPDARPELTHADPAAVERSTALRRW